MTDEEYRVEVLRLLREISQKLDGLGNKLNGIENAIYNCRGV